MVQGEGTNPQVGKVTVEDFARRIKEKYPQYIDVDDLELTQRIIDKYPQYKNTVSFEPTAVKKKTQLFLQRLWVALHPLKRLKNSLLKTV